MVSAVAALGDIVRSPDEKLDRIADGSVSDSERATGLARLSTCIADAGIIVALQKAIASPLKTIPIGSHPRHRRGV